MPYLPYEEPGITTILSLASFLLLLNGIRYALDRILYCGIIGEILIGMIWGLPVGGTAWLSKGTQETVQAYGYLGLIGLVFEGGLSMDLSMLRKTVFLSISIATVGLLMPIALSFILLVLPFPSSSTTMYPTPLAGFSAGASLCSTSLGTTFAILSSANLLSTRVGTVLVGAAMMDDVVGLVMVNIVTTLGDGGMGGWQIARPIAASFGLLLVTLAVAPYILKPIWNWLCIFLHVEEGPVTETSKKCFRTTASQLANRIPHIFFMLSTAVLIIFVTIASYIEASVLFAAFIAGGVVKFLCGVQAEGDSTNTSSPSNMYKIYYKSLIEYILAPFFFVGSILPSLSEEFERMTANHKYTGFYWFFYSYHRHVPRINCMERSCLFDIDGPCQRACLFSNLPGILYKAMDEAEAQSQPTKPEHGLYRNIESASYEPNYIRLSRTATHYCFTRRVCYDISWRDWILDRFSVSELWDFGPATPGWDKSIIV